MAPRHTVDSVRHSRLPGYASLMPTDLPSGRVQPRFAGLATFMRLPQLSMVRAEHQPVEWCVYGIPFDGGVTYHPGARFGPRAIRDASQYVKPCSPELGIDLAQRFSMADAGDSPVTPYSCAENVGMVQDFATGLGDPDLTRLLALGGDHSVALANMRVAWQRAGRPASGLPLIHLDAHLDTVDVVWGERYGHASVLIRAIEEGIIDPQRTISIGARGPLNSLADLDYGREAGITVVGSSRWHDDRTSVDAAIAEFRTKLGDDECYLTLDVDVCDPSVAPGTGTPVCGGLSSADLFSILRTFAGTRLAGADVVEVCPARDVQEITALLAAHAAFQILCIDAAAHPE